MAESVIESPYRVHADFWRTQTPRVMGDLRQRPSAVRLLGNLPNQVVLDCGCGAGYTTRLVGRTGATVVAFDREPPMLRHAQDMQEGESSKIEYLAGDLARLPFRDSFFDAILSVGSLIHVNSDIFKAFLGEAQRVLRESGTIVISIEHPFIFTAKSPTRKPGPSWAKHIPMNKSESSFIRPFNENYIDMEGNVFTSIVWNHQRDFCMEALRGSGFFLEEMKDVLVEEEDLISPLWGREWGYPAFLQIKAVKQERPSWV